MQGRRGRKHLEGPCSNVYPQHLVHLPVEPFASRDEHLKEILTRYPCVSRIIGDVGYRHHRFCNSTATGNEWFQTELAFSPILYQFPVDLIRSLTSRSVVLARERRGVFLKWREMPGHMSKARAEQAIRSLTGLELQVAKTMPVLCMCVCARVCVCVSARGWVHVRVRVRVLARMTS
jgi:hypothetical protein